MLSKNTCFVDRSVDAPSLTACDSAPEMKRSTIQEALKIDPLVENRSERVSGVTSVSQELTVEKQHLQVCGELGIYSSGRVY